MFDQTTDSFVVGSPTAGDLLNSLDSTFALPGLSGSQWKPGEAQTFLITVRFPLATSNEFQGAGVTFSLTWEGAS